MELHTKSATPGHMQVTYTLAPVENKSLGETVTDFFLAGFVEASTAVLINIERAFTGYGEKIRLPTTEFLLCAVVGDLNKSKKLQDWTSMNTVFLPEILA